jgi:hypothetical protein
VGFGNEGAKRCGKWKRTKIKRKKEKAGGAKVLMLKNSQID